MGMLSPEDVKQIAEVLEQNFLPQFERINERFDQVDKRFDRLEGRMESLERRVDRVDGKVNVLINVLRDKRVIGENDKRKILL